MTTLTATTTQDAYLESFERTRSELSGSRSERLNALSARAMERFSALGFPTSRMEEWRFTNVKPIAEARFNLAPSVDGIAEGAVARYAYADCHQLVLVNGRFSAELSQLGGLPEGVVVCSLAEALERHPETVDAHLGRYAKFEEHAFVALNTALHCDGAFVWVPRGLVLEKPVNLVLLGRSEGDPSAFFPRSLVVAEESSQLTLIEQHASVGDAAYFNCPVTEVVTAANAVVDHYKLQRESTEALHVATLQVWQDRDSNFKSHSISWGGGLVRNDVNAVLDGEGCESTLNGLYMVEGKQVVDNHMRVEHAAAHCDSHELYKGILEGRSRAVFSGRIYVHPGAQKTDAKQTNRNLLLSDEALCNSHPQLEIFADDVRCTHGSTVGQLDKDAVFYLRSRGIGEEAARSLLTYAFAADIVERIKVGPVRQDLEEFLFRRLPRGEIVRQAV